MDKRKYNESIKLLEEAQKLDPVRIDYPYEMAYAYYLKGDYQGAIKIAEKHIGRKDVTVGFFQLLGNSYDVVGKSEKAFEVYDAGLEKFPNSGSLYLEKGNVYWMKEDYNTALPFYEKGIEVDPQFPSNYYRAAKLFCSSTEEVWGMIYGEIFMNLERNSDRTAEISKLLYDTYQSEIKFTSDTSMTVSFCQQMFVDIKSISDPKNIKLPFCLIYEPTLMMSIPLQKSIDLQSLDKIRSAFVDNYYNNKREALFPNVLFGYQKKIKDEGHMEAYNYWILMKGDEDAFDEWKSANEEKWAGFVKWFNVNQLKLDDENRFYRGQY